MHASMQAQGVPATDAPAGDADPAAIPFLAVLPDLSIHVAVLEPDFFDETAPLATRTRSITLGPSGDTASLAEPPPAVPTDATGAPTAPSTIIQLSRPSATPLTRTVSGRLRQFGLVALPSLRRADLSDIPDSLVWSVAIVDPAHAERHPHLLPPPRTSRLGRTHSLRRRGSTASTRAPSRTGSLRASGSIADAYNLPRSGSIPFQKHPGAGDPVSAPPPCGSDAGPYVLLSGMQPAVPTRQASEPLPPTLLAPRLPEGAHAPGARLVSGDGAVSAFESGAAVSALGPWPGRPGKPQRSRSLRAARSLRSCSGDGRERLADVHEMPGEVQ